MDVAAIEMISNYLVYDNNLSNKSQSPIDGVCSIGKNRIIIENLWKCWRLIHDKHEFFKNSSKEAKNNLSPLIISLEFQRQYVA